MPLKIIQGSLPNHKALALVVLGTLLTACMASGDTSDHPLLATDSYGGVHIATFVKRQLRTTQHMTNDIPNNDGERILSLTPESFTAISNTIGRTSEWIKSKSGYFDFILFEEIGNCIDNEQTPTVALKLMGLLDKGGRLQLDNPATAKYQEFVERYLKETNSLKSAVDVILAAYIRSDPTHIQSRIKRLKNAYDTSGRNSFGGRLYKAQLNAWREKEPKVVAEEMDLHIANPYAEPGTLIIWLDYLGLRLNLPTLGNGYDDARNIILKTLGETFGEGPDMLLEWDSLRLASKLDDYLLDWRQALQSGDNLKAYALKNLAPLES